MSARRAATAGLVALPLLAACGLAPAPQPADARLPAAPAPPAARAPLGPAPPELRQLVADVFAPALRAQPDRTVFPGLIVGVVRGPERHVVALGRLDAPCAQTPAGCAPEDLLFPVASLTKPVTALLLARLATRGELQLDAPALDAARYPDLCPGGASITWRQLATHTSGLPVLPGDLGSATSEASFDAWDAARLQAWLATARLEQAPGARFEYSTTGYAVLGLELARRRGEPFDRLLRDEVLEPLGLRDARFALTADERARLVAGHRRDGTPVAEPAARAAGVFAPSGGLIASAADLLAFLEANIRPDDAWREPVALLLAPHDDIPTWPPSVMALGWQLLAPAGFYWHAGHGSGHHGFMAFHPAGQVGVVVLASSATSPADTRLAEASFTLLGALLAAPADGAR